MTDTQQSTRRSALEREIGHQVAALHQAAKRAITRMARRVSPELQPVGFAVLRVVIDSAEGVRAGDLGVRLGMDKSAVSRQVAQLRELGLVETAPDPLDGRASILTATASAREAVEEARADIRVDYQRIFDGWDDDDLESFARHLERFVETNSAVERRHGSDSSAH